MMKTEIRPPESLKQHPLHEGVPMNTDDHPDMVVIVESMRAEGFNPDHPIKINASGEIMDGRHRARAAVLAGLVSVPVVIKDDSEAENIIVNSLLCRRHFSKEMFAYVLYPLLSKNALQKGQTLKNARKSEMSRNATSAAAELESRGISRDIWYRAQQLRVAFAKRPKLREKFEPQLMSGAMTPTQVHKAIGSIIGYEEEQYKPGADRALHGTIIASWLTKVTKQFKFWDKLPSKEKHAALAAFAQEVHVWPADVRQSLLEELKTIARAEG